MFIKTLLAWQAFSLADRRLINDAVRKKVCKKKHETEHFIGGGGRWIEYRSRWFTRRKLIALINERVSSFSNLETVKLLTNTAVDFILKDTRRQIADGKLYMLLSKGLMVQTCFITYPVYE